MNTYTEDTLVQQTTATQPISLSSSLRGNRRMAATTRTSGRTLDREVVLT